MQNLNTPIIFEIKAPPHFIHMSKRHFLTLDQINGIQIISFEGKILCTPKFQGLRPEYLVKEMISVSSEILAVVDSVDSKNIYILDAFLDSFWWFSFFDCYNLELSLIVLLNVTLDVYTVDLK